MRPSESEAALSRLISTFSGVMMEVHSVKMRSMPAPLHPLVLYLSANELGVRAREKRSAKIALLRQSKATEHTKYPYVTDQLHLSRVVLEKTRLRQQLPCHTLKLLLILRHAIELIFVKKS